MSSLTKKECGVGAGLLSPPSTSLFKLSAFAGTDLAFLLPRILLQLIRPRYLLCLACRVLSSNKVVASISAIFRMTFQGAGRRHQWCGCTGLIWVFDPQIVRLDQCFLEAILFLLLILARGGTTRDAGLVVVSLVESY